MSKPIYNIDNNPRAFNQELLDSITYLKRKGSSLCLIGKIDDLDDLSNIERYHVKEPVYFAPILADGNCAMRAVVLSLLMQGVLDNKQLLTVGRLCQIFKENKDKVKEIYGIVSPQDLDHFIEEYSTLTPEKCANFFKYFLPKLESSEIFEFLITCLRLDIFYFCKNNFTDSLVNKFDTKEFFDENLNELPVIGSHVDAEFLRFYLQYSHQISIDVYQIYQDRKELDPWFYSEDNHPRQEQRSQNLHLNIVFHNNHFDTVIFKKDIDQYLERNQNKCLGKQLGCALEYPLLNEFSVLNKKEAQVSITQDPAWIQKKKEIGSPTPDYFEPIKYSQELKENLSEKLEKNESEALEIRSNKCAQISNDLNKKAAQITTTQDPVWGQAKKEMDPPALDASEPIKYSKEIKETSSKTLEKNESKVLAIRSDEWSQPNNDPVINKKDTQVSTAQGQTRKQKNKSFVKRSSPNYLELINSSQEPKETVPKILEKNENELLKKRLNLLEERLCSQDSVVNEKSTKSTLRYLIRDLKSELTGSSSWGSFDHPAQRLLNQAQLILNKPNESEEQLREDSTKLKEILIQHQEEKLNFYFMQKKMLKRLDLIEGYLSKRERDEPTASPSLKKGLENELASQSWHRAVDSLDRTLIDQAKFILMKSDESEKQLREDAKELREIYRMHQQEKLKFSPGFLSNKKNDCRRQQANQTGSNTDLFTNPKLLK